MLALGIDTSSQAGSVGLADDTGLHAELNLSSGHTHSRRLLPSVQSLLEAAGVKLGDLDLLAVAVGPGSFTGLRIGMATAKGLAMALERPLIGFSTLETIALAVSRGLPPDSAGLPPIGVMLEAGRGEVYRGLFRADGERIEPMMAEAAVTPERAAEGLPERCVLCGDGARALAARQPAVAASRVVLHGPTPFIGATLARRALDAAARGGLESLPPLTPNYLRLSDAEMTFKG